MSVVQIASFWYENFVVISITQRAETAFWSAEERYVNVMDDLSGCCVFFRESSPRDVQASRRRWKLANRFTLPLSRRLLTVVTSPPVGLQSIAISVSVLSLIHISEPTRPY